MMQLLATVEPFMNWLGRGGGVTTICSGTGCATFWVAFFEAEISFGVSFLIKSQIDIDFEVSF